MDISLSYSRAVAVICGLSLIVTLPATADVLKIQHQGIERRADLHEPMSLGTAAAPLVIVLHGLGQTLEGVQASLPFDGMVDREQFRVIYPEAIDKSWSYGRAINQPMPMVGTETVDDVGFIRLLIDDLITRKIADPNRIYVTGMSRGGLMAFTLACALADRIAAVAPLISGMTGYQREDCRPSHVRSIMVLAGAADVFQSFAGAQAPRGRLLSVPDTVNYWSSLHGCNGNSSRQIPHRDPEDRTQITVIEWTGCRDGGRVLFFRVDGGGHQIPSLTNISSEAGIKRFGLRNRDIETAEEIWAFFKPISR